MYLHVSWEALWPAKLCVKTNICGVLSGLAYYVLLLTVSVMAKGGWDMSAAHAVTTFFMCTGGGTLGGMLS